MQRRAATTLHLALSVVGVVLYVLFVLPRWWVLTGDFPDTLATVGRVAAGVPIALAAVPVMLNLRQSIKPELGTPELALRLRAWSAVLHVVAGVVIILTAIAEIWINSAAAGPWLFAVYGAAAATAVLGIAAYYLSAVAEKPPDEPKPPKAAKPPREKKEKRRKRGGKIDEGSTISEEVKPAAEVTDEVPAIAQTIDADAAEVETQADISDTDVETAEVSATVEEPAASGLRNKRPTGKSRHRLPR